MRGKGRRWKGEEVERGRRWEGEQVERGGDGYGKGKRWRWEGEREGGIGTGWVWISYYMVWTSCRNQVEREEKKSLIAAGQNVADHTFSAEEVGKGSDPVGVAWRGWSRRAKLHPVQCKELMLLSLWVWPVSTPRSVGVACVYPKACGCGLCLPQGL